jgi:hypothetical protein
MRDKNQNPDTLRRQKSIREVLRVEESRETLITKKVQIVELAELPCLKAVEALYDLNIETTDSNANLDYYKSFESGELSPGPYEARISLNPDTLSEENKRIAKREGFWKEDEFGVSVQILVSFNEESTVGQIEDEFLEKIQKFKPQVLSWTPRYIPDEVKERYIRLYHLGEELTQRVQELIDSEVEAGRLYFDQDSNTYFVSQEHAEKYKESLKYATGAKV